MMMNTTGSTSRLAPFTPNRQFFQWAVKWFYGKEPVNTPTNPDLPSIVGLLQALGFKLRDFGEKEKHIHVQDELKNENIQMVIQCGTSKMVAILEMDNVKCACPDTNVANDGSFWSITGINPGPIRDDDDVNKIEESGSNLLPEPSKEVKSLVRDITYKLFQIINNKDDTGPACNSDVNNATITKSTEIKEGLVRSYTDINDNNYKPRTMAIITSNLVSTKFNSTKSITQSQRRRTYELHDRNESIIEEPRPSPAKIASLPMVHPLSTFLGEVSIESEDEIYNLAGYVVKAHQILDKAVAHIVKNLPISSSRSSVYEEGLPIKSAASPLSNSGFNANRIMKKKSSSGTSASSRQSSASSLSSRTTSSSSKISKDKDMTRRSAGTRSLLPVARDRAASCGSVPKTLALAANARRKVATATPSTAQRSTISSASKLPTSKSGQIRTANHLTISERGILSDKKSPAAHGHVSLIKPPSRTPKLSASSSVTSYSKFGYPTEKK